jgi:hypothetical protein
VHCFEPRESKSLRVLAMSACIPYPLCAYVCACHQARASGAVGRGGRRYTPQSFRPATQFSTAGAKHHEGAISSSPVRPAQTGIISQGLAAESPIAALMIGTCARRCGEGVGPSVQCGLAREICRHSLIDIIAHAFLSHPEAASRSSSEGAPKQATAPRKSAPLPT